MNWVTRSIKTWDEMADECNTWDHLWQEGPRAETLQFFTDFVGNPPLKVLDHGCGTGESTRLLNNLGYQAIGVDQSTKMVDLAKQRGVEAYVSISTPLPFTAHEFDAVFACTSLEWCAEPHKLIKELIRVVKPGGSLVLATLGAIASPRKTAYRRLYGQDVSHNMLMPWELHQLVLDHGLVCEAMHGAFPRNEYIPKAVIDALEGKWTAQAALATIWSFGIRKPS